MGREFDLRQFFRILRARWWLIALLTLLGGGLGAAYAWTKKPTYTAHTELFVSTVGPSNNPAETYQGGLFAQQRVLSYVGVVSSPPVLQPVIARLGLPLTVQGLQREITATVPPNTVLIDLTVSDHSPSRAQAIANAVSAQFARYVSRLEATKPTGGSGHSSSAVKVSVVSAAHLPTSPSSPRKPLDIGLGALVGLILGIAGAVGLEFWDRRIRDSDEISSIVGAPVIGSMPTDGKADKRPLITRDDPHSVVAESYRRLRTYLAIGGGVHDQRTFAICSAMAGEGKTLIAANLAVAFAQAGHHTILVDADLRRPRIADLMGLLNVGGLADVLTGRAPVEKLLRAHESLPLEILESGSPPPNPSELLAGFDAVLKELADRAEIVIIDTPALLPVTDASIIAPMASGTILVARVGKTRTRQLEAGARSLRLVGAEVVGVVANCASPASAYGGRYRRYSYAPAGGTENGLPPADVTVPSPPNSQIG